MALIFCSGRPNKAALRCCRGLDLPSASQALLQGAGGGYLDPGLPRAKEAGAARLCAADHSFCPQVAGEEDGAVPQGGSETQLPSSPSQKLNCHSTQVFHLTGMQRTVSMCLPTDERAPINTLTMTVRDLLRAHHPTRHHFVLRFFLNQSYSPLQDLRSTPQPS